MHSTFSSAELQRKPRLGPDKPSEAPLRGPQPPALAPKAPKAPADAAGHSRTFAFDSRRRCQHASRII